MRPQDLRIHDPWACPIPKRSDPARLRINFETADEAVSERNLRMRHLRRAGIPEATWLAQELASCTLGVRCRSAACPICYRRFRRWWVGNTLQLLRGIPSLVHATLVHAEDAVSLGRIQDISLGNMADALRQRLRRAGLRGIVIGGIDGEYDVAHGVWQPHYHLIFPAVSVPSFEVLRRYYPSDGRVYRPVLVQPAHDRAQQISYCVKGYWPQKVRYVDRFSQKRTRKLRLDEPLHVAWLLWRAQLLPTEITFLQGVRRYGCKLRRAIWSDP
jgi:hypothetical protein